MKYKILYKNKVYLFQDKADLVKSIIPTLKKHKNDVNLTQKQKIIVNNALKNDYITLTFGNFSAKMMIEMIGGELINERH